MADRDKWYQFLLFFTPISHGEQKIRSLMHLLLLLAKYCDGIIDNVQHCKDEFMMAQLGSIEGKKEKPACINLSLLAPPFYTWSRFQKTRLKLVSQLYKNASEASYTSLNFYIFYKQLENVNKQLKNVNKQLNNVNKQLKNVNKQLKNVNKQRTRRKQTVGNRK